MIKFHAFRIYPATPYIVVRISGVELGISPYSGFHPSRKSDISSPYRNSACCQIKLYPTIEKERLNFVYCTLFDSVFRIPLMSSIS